MAEWFPARAVLELLLWVADERAVCVPTWVLTCGCKTDVEVDGFGVPGEVRAGPLCEWVAPTQLWQGKSGENPDVLDPRMPLVEVVCSRAVHA